MKVYGTFRVFKEEVVMVGIHVEQVKDHNEIVNHLLRVMAAQQERMKGPITHDAMKSAPGASQVSNNFEDTVYRAAKRFLDN